MNQVRPRVLVLGGNVSGHHPIAAALQQCCDVDTFDTLDEAMAALRREMYHAVFADVGDFLPLERGLVGQQSSLVLDTIGEGVCVVNAASRCTWSNKRMQDFTPDVFLKVKQICCQALAIFANQRRNTGRDAPPRSKKFAFQAEDKRYFELITSPVIDERGAVNQVVAVVWDATSGRRLQQKIDAIDKAGRELTKLEGEVVAKLAPGDRLDLLKNKIIRYSKDLLHFDHFVIRILDKRSNKLELVIAEGLPTEAMQLDLYAQPEGNGVSGYVAATGRSYVCHDVEKDARYVLGMEHGKSSLTVPLFLHDRVVGVFNIESDAVGAFAEDDRQFAEIFGRYVALALNILDLLIVERYTTTGKLADSVVEELAEPLNDIMTEAQSLMEEYIGDDMMRNRLNTIHEQAQAIRNVLNEVAAGPRSILGSNQVRVEKIDPLLAGKRVLIADDEPNIRQTMKEILSKHGCECSVCKDGYEAISQIEHTDFDLIVSDIKMPHRNGYEIFAAARRRDDSIPVLLMTGFGYDPHHSIVRASQEGLSSVLFKPFKVDQLMDEVRKALGGAQEESRAPQEATDTSA